MASRIDRARFAADGFVLLRGAIDPARVARARARIATALAADSSVGRMREMMGSTFVPEIASDPAILDAFVPLVAPIGELFGAAIAAPSRAQIALRFPERAIVDPRHGFHVDGFPSEGNQVPRGTVRRATLLVGVYLTPVRGPSRGNFVAWPGSHHAVAARLREIDALRVLREQGAEAVLDAVRAMDLGPGEQLEVEPGDALLAHHLLAHGASDNLSLHVREALYARVSHPSDLPHDPEPLLDPDRFFTT